MSGRDTFSGTDFQSRVGAYIAAHVLARHPLPPRFGVARPVPIGIAFEQDGAGDDIHVTLAGEQIVEIQAKHGLKADQRLAETIAAFAERLDAGRFALLVVDSGTSSRPITKDLKLAFEHWRNGQAPPLTDELARKLAPLLESGREGTRTRIAVWVVDVDSDDTDGVQYATGLLRQCLVDPLMAEHAWTALNAIASTASKNGYAYARARLVELMNERGLEVAADERADVGARPSLARDALTSGLRTELPEKLQAIATLIDATQPSAALALLDAIDNVPAGTDEEHAQRCTLRGVALLQLDRHDEGRAQLERALALGRRSATTLVNLAFTEDELGDHARAVELAREATTVAPKHPLAWATRIHLGDLESIEALPDDVRAHALVQTAFATAALRAGKPLEAVELLTPITEPPAELDVHRTNLLAAALLSASEQADQPTSRALATRALALLDRVLANVQDMRAGLRRTAAWNRGIALEEVGDVEGARAAFKALATEEPVRAEAAARFAYRALAAHRDLDEASAALARVRPQNGFLRALRARVLVAAGDTAAATRELAAAVARSDDGGEPDMDELITVANAAIDLGDAATAHTALDAIDEPPDARVHVMRARLAVLDGRTDDARGSFEAAIAAAIGSDQREIQIEYGAHLRSRGAFHDALAILASVAFSGDERVARLVAEVAYAAGEFSRAERIAADYEDRAWGARMAAYIAGQRADFRRAEAAFLRWAELAPALSEPVMNAAALALERGDSALGRRLLTKITVAKLAPKEKLHVAGLWLRAEDPAGAMRLAYAALRETPDDDDIVLAYFQLAARAGQADAFVPPTTITVGVSVELRSASGSTAAYLITDVAPARAILGELHVSDPVAAQLMGKTRGETIALRTNPTELATITDLTDERGHGFRWALAELQRRGPGGGTVRPIHVPPGDSAAALASVTETLQPRAHDESEVVALFGRQLLPLGAAAQKLGNSIVATYWLFARDVDRRRAVEEIDASPAVEAAAAPRLVLTRTALLTIEVLGILDLLASSGSTMLVTPDLLRQLRVERAEHAEVARHGRTAFGLVDGRLALHETTRDEGKQQLERANALLAWIERHCTPILPDRPSNRAPEWDVIGDESEQAVLAAAQHQAVLFCDDLGLRRLAHAERQVVSTSTYAWITSMRRRERLTDDELDRHVGVLLELGQTAIPPKVEHAVAALRRDARRLRPFARVIGHLREPYIDASVASRFIVRVLRLVTLEPELRASLATIADQCFDAVLGPRRDVQHKIAMEVRQALRRDFILLGPERDRLLLQLAAFLERRSLI